MGTLHCGCCPAGLPGAAQTHPPAAGCSRGHSAARHADGVGRASPPICCHSSVTSTLCRADRMWHGCWHAACLQGGCTQCCPALPAHCLPSLGASPPPSSPCPVASAAAGRSHCRWVGGRCRTRIDLGCKCLMGTAEGVLLHVMNACRTCQRSYRSCWVNRLASCWMSPLPVWMPQWH